MSQDTGGRWKPRSVYNHVRENKRDDLVEAHRNLGIVTPAPGKNIVLIDDLESVSDESCVNESGLDNYSVCQDEDHDEDGGEWFDLKLTRAKWEEIKPDNTSPNKKKTLKPRVWGNVIAKAFWRRYNFPCAFVFKWSYVSYQSDDKEHISYFLKIKGSCTSKKCKNTFLGIADKDPGMGDLHLRIKTRDTRQEYHENVKRPLNGKERKIVGIQLKSQSATVFRRKLAKDNMVFGDDEPYFLQSNQVYRQAKMEHINEELGLKHQDRRDIIKSIENMSTETRYVNVVCEVGSNPFHVFYCTPAQLYVYREYCRVIKNESKICIDATGSLIKKFETRLDRKSSHIFLYSINFEQTTLTVNQMLSEKHNTEFIEYWLKNWLRMGASPPNEAHCDWSRALLTALCEAFNQQTIKNVDSLFLSAMKGNRKCDQWRPSTFLRIDVAHIMHFCAKWQSIKTQKHPYLKSFYLRTIALMIDCQSVEEFKQIMLLTCMIALQPYEDTIIILPEFQLSVKEARQTLEKFISVRGPIIQELEISATSYKKEYRDTIEMTESSDDKNLTVTHRWIKTLINMVKPYRWIKTLINMVDKNLEKTGTEINAFYLPNFVDQIKKIAKEFPLWTAAIVPNKKRHASTAYIEGYFADLKDKVFKDFPKPMAVNRFLRVHVDDLIGAANLFARILKHFNMQRLPISSTESTFKTKEHHNKLNFTNSNMESTSSFQNLKVYNKINDSDLKSRELWRGLVNENNVLFEIDQDETLDKERNVETLNDQTKIIVDSLHNEDIHQIDNSNLKWSKSDKDTIVDCVHDFTNYRQSSNDPEVEDKTKDLQNSIFSKLLNLKSDDMLELIDDNLFLDTQEDQPFFVDTASSVPAIPAFSSTPLLDHSYANLTNSNEQEILIEENNRTDTHEDTKKDKINMISNNDKPQAQSYYFKPYPEIKVINQMKVPQKKGFLLPNGLISKPVKFERKTVFVENTCGFDALIQILHFSALDDPVYCSKIQSSSNETLQLVNAFMKKGSTNDIFLQRFLILRKFYQIVQRTDTTTSLDPYFLNAENSIGAIWSELFDSEPSLFKTYDCNNPTCNFEPKNIPFFSVNHRTIGRNGFGALEKAIQFHSRIYKIQCPKKECNGIATEINLINFHIFIELDIRPQIQMTAGMKCTLGDFPIILNLEKKYRLAGVIGYTPGHFISYCRRITGRWLLCNNLKTVIESCSDKTTITPHGIIYIAQ